MSDYTFESNYWGDCCNTFVFVEEWINYINNLP